MVKSQQKFFEKLSGEQRDMVVADEGSKIKGRLLRFSKMGSTRV